MRLFLVGLFAVIPISLFAQQLDGRVVYVDDTGKVVAASGASVSWKGTSKGAYVDTLGRFSIARVQGHDTLVIRLLGFTELVSLRPENDMEFTLSPSTTQSVIVDAQLPTILRSAEKTEFIGQKQLKQAACCSLAESFEKSPSVEVSYSDAASGARQIQMLGLRGLYSQVLIEAVPLIRALEIPFGLEHVPGPFMESVSISKGAGTVTNGYDAITGLINICYHNPRTAPSLFVNAYGNSVSRAELNVYGTQHITDELSTMTMLHGRIMTHSTDVNGDGFSDQPTFKQINAVHRWYYNDESIEWQVFVRGFSDHYQGGQIDGHEHDVLGHYAINTDINRLDGFVKFGLLDVFDAIPESGISFVVSPTTHEQRTLFGKNRVTGDENSMLARAVISLPFSETIKFLGGLTYLLDHVRESVTPIAPTVTTPPGAAFSRTEQVPGIYGEATISPIEELAILIGLRYDMHNLYGNFLTPRMHVKYSITDFTSVRASAGRGWRVPSVIIENMPSFISSRRLVFDSSFNPEEAWNFGGSFTTTLEIDERPITFDIEAYQTIFQNQVIIDFDRSPSTLFITNALDQSSATSVLAQVLATPLPRFEILVAYRWQDVVSLYNGSMQQKPLTSRERILTTLSYSTPEQDWQFDATVSWNSGGRVPISELSAPKSFEGWWRINGQITKKFGDLDVYLGTENLTNFVQPDAVQGADKPYTPLFDASLVWGPLDPRLVYIGARFTLQ